MIPLKDHNPRLYRPIVTVTLIVLNIIAFFFELGPLTDQELWFPFADMWALIPIQLITAPAAELYTIFTSMFLHGGLMHIGGNMLYLWIFGDNIEDSLGHGRFLLFYLTCGVVAALVHVYADPSSNIPTIGASGAVAGVLGGYFLLFPMTKVRTMVPILLFRRFNIPAWILLGIWFALQVLSGWGQVASGEEAGVAFWAHVGGFVAGVLLVRLMGNNSRLNEQQIAYLQREMKETQF